MKGRPQYQNTILESFYDEDMDHTELGVDSSELAAEAAYQKRQQFTNKNQGDANKRKPSTTSIAPYDQPPILSLQSYSD